LLEAITLQCIGQMGRIEQLLGRLLFLIFHNKTSTNYLLQKS
jgi:hypothetical protein